MAVDLNGSNQAVNLGNPANVWNTTGAITLSAWVLVDVDNGGRVISRQRAGGSRGYQISSEADGSFHFAISPDGSAILDVGATLTVGVWQHWVGVYLPSIYTRIYRNGEMAGENITSIPATQFSNSNELQIGRRPDNILFFNGKLADCAIWHRALSANEVRGLYRFGPHLYKPLAWYPLQSDGNFVQDWSGNKLNGTLIGTPTTFNNPPKRLYSSTFWDFSVNSSSANSVIVNADVNTITLNEIDPQINYGSSVSADTNTLTFNENDPIIFGSDMNSITMWGERYWGRSYWGARYWGGGSGSSANSVIVNADINTITLNEIDPQINYGSSVSADTNIFTFNIQEPNVDTTENVTASPDTNIFTFNIQEPYIYGYEDSNEVSRLSLLSLPGANFEQDGILNAYISSDINIFTFNTIDPLFDIITNTTVSTDVNIFTFNAIDPSVIEGVGSNISSDINTFTFNIQEPTISLVENVTISTDVNTFTFNEIDPNINYSCIVSADTNSLSFTSITPNVVSDGNAIVEVGVISFSFNENEPYIYGYEESTEISRLSLLSLPGANFEQDQNTNVYVSVDVLSFSFNENEPYIYGYEESTEISRLSLLSLPGANFEQDQNTNVYVSVDVLSVQFNQPSVLIETKENVTVFADINTFSFNIQEPNVDIITNVTASADTNTFTLNEIEPTISAVQNTSVVSDVNSITFTPNQASAGAEISVSFSVDVNTLSFNLDSLTIRNGVTVSTDVNEISYNIPELTVSTIRNINVSADSNSLIFNVINPESVGEGAPQIVTLSGSNEISFSINNPTITIELGDWNEVSCIENDNFFNHLHSDYNNESLLYDKLLCEGYNHFGVYAVFYVTSYNTSHDEVFGEDTNIRIVRKFDFRCYYELPKEEELWSSYSIEGIDNFHIFIAKTHFAEASKRNTNNVVAYDSYVPKSGDIIKAKYNDYYYEIVKVKEEIGMFHQRKHAWDCIVKPYRVNHYSLSADTSATMTDISAVTDEADIFDIDDIVNNEKTDILYTPKSNESSPDDPFANW